MRRRRILAKGVGRSDRHVPRKAVLPQPGRRSVADGPAPAAQSIAPTPSSKPTKPKPPNRTTKQARKDANSARVVAEALREAVFLSLLQRGAPDLVRIYMAKKMGQRGCGGCGMKSMFNMIHDEIRLRSEQVAMKDALAYLRDRGWS